MLSAVLPLYSCGAVELAVLGLLLVPLPPLNSLGLAVVGLAKSSTGLVVSGTLALVLMAFMLAGIFGGLETETLGSLGQGQEAQLMAITALANLAGGFALGKLAGTLTALNKLKVSHAALKKQADGLQLAYKTLQEEAESGMGKAAAGESPLDKAKKALEEEREKRLALDQTNAKLAKENDRLAAEKKGAEATSEALKRQATSVMREYERLQAENESLKDQLADMDANPEAVVAKKGP